MCSLGLQDTLWHGPITTVLGAFCLAAVIMVLGTVLHDLIWRRNERKRQAADQHVPTGARVGSSRRSRTPAARDVRVGSGRVLSEPAWERTPIVWAEHGQTMKSQVAILVVDDVEAICTGCRRALAKEGFQVEYTTDSTEGLRMAEGREYDAVLLDLRMPDLDGLKFLERLRSTRPTLPVLVITGYPSVESASECLRLGAHDFISKPFTPEKIRDSVRKVVAGMTA